MSFKKSDANFITEGKIKPTSRFFIFENLVSENSISQSWSAINCITRKPCFTKATKSDGSLDDETAKSVLLRSFDLQKTLKADGILRAHGIYQENGRLFIEYPYLDQKSWQVLNSEIFWKLFPAIFLKICIIVDYLHLMGLVHCDLKFENFQVNISKGDSLVMLLDPDFLIKAHSRPDSNIFGTPDHIAPEILENDVVLVQSDNYTLGISLKRYLKEYQNGVNDLAQCSGIDIGRIQSFAEELILHDPLLRPRFLLDALLKHRIIGGHEFLRAQKVLLGMKLLSNFRLRKSEIRRNKEILKSILSEHNGIFGFPDELTEDLALMYKIRPLNTFRLLVSIIEKADVKRYEDNWQLIISDHDLIQAFREIARTTQKNELRFFPDFSGDRLLSDNQYEEILRPDKSNSSLKRFLVLKQLIDFNDGHHFNGSLMIKQQVLQKLGQLAQSLGRLEEAVKYFSDALVIPHLNDQEKCEIIYDIGYNYLLLGKSDDCGIWLRRGKELSEAIGDGKRHFAFLRQEVWLAVFYNRFEEIEMKLASLITKAKESGFLDELGKLMVVRGILYWRKGDFSKAEESLLEGLPFLREAKSRFDLISPLSNLSLLYFELAEYKKAISYGEKAAELAENLSQLSHLPLIYNNYANLVISNGRLGNYEKAEYWLHKYFTAKSPKYDSFFFRNFYSYQGNIYLKRGQLREAREALYKALSLYESGEKDRNLGKIFQNLLLIALFQGKDLPFHEYLQKGKKVFDGFGDKASLAEIELLEKFKFLYSSDSPNTLSLLATLDELLRYNCRYYAALCMFHILLYADKETVREAISNRKEALSFINGSGVPLFEALSALYESEDVLLDNNLKSLHYLKNAYRQLMASGDRFYALLLCQRIAEIYQSASSVRLAGKFYLQAKKLAESLGNITLANSIAQKAGTLFNQPFDHTRILKLLHGISEILKNIGDYDSALENLVRFAVNESGAERGVLLLSADDHSELAVKLLVNCDPESIEDIKQFSRSVIKMVSREMTPLFIDNAREDSRTKGYKSILAHNILSVICLPIRIDERLAGVLYLDHRTIPALFEPEDITFIHSIANFISLLLSTIRDYRHQVETKKQLTDDFIKLGVTKKFITQNETMKSLFSRLPEIARSNISILLVGESGTGKEILGQMIHDLSLRSKGPLIKLNCAAIAESLIESELFGVAKNVATGVNEREGKLSAADGGTLFLDEIGDMPMDIQSKILRVLEYQSFEKVGSNRTIFTDIRFVYATNKDLKSLIKQGKFREDLYYRINAIIIHIPPLCERLDDIPLLLDHFLTVFSPHQNKRPIILSSALEALLAYSWPGNVRELKNLVEKYCLLYSGKEVDLTDLPSEILDNKNPKTEGKHLAEELEKAKTRDLLISNDWNQSEVSRIMGIPLSTLRRKIKKYRILKGL